MPIPQRRPINDGYPVDSILSKFLYDDISIDEAELRAGSYYWARRIDGAEIEVVLVTNVFGPEREYWSVATMGSDQHYSLREFEFLIKLMKP